MPRGSRPGERRGGRAPGVPNKLTAEIKEICRAFGSAAVQRLAELAGLVPGVKAAEADAAKIAALREILDRAYGRPMHPIGGDVGEPITVVIRRFGQGFWRTRHFDGAAGTARIPICDWSLAALCKERPKRALIGVAR